MSEERFARIEERLDVMGSDIRTLKTDVAELKTDVAELKTDVAALKTDVAALRTAVVGNSADIMGLKGEVVDLRRHMGVLHEDLVDRIMAVGENDGLSREMQAGFAELRQILTDHMIVGDAADRQFATRLDDHEHRIRTLEGR